MFPVLNGSSFKTAIIERYRRRESGVEEALIEMYLTVIAVRRVEDITEALWGSKKHMSMKHLEAMESDGVLAG